MNQYQFKPQMIPCAMCGAEILATHNKMKFCPECRKRREREGQLRYRARMRKKRKAEKPEDGIDREVHYCDSPENVQKCLNCTKPKCTNCLYSGTNTTKKRKPYVISDEVREKVVLFVNQGMRQKEIAKKLGVSEPTVSRWVAGLRWDGAL